MGYNATWKAEKEKSQKEYEKTVKRQELVEILQVMLQDEHSANAEMMRTRLDAMKHIDEVLKRLRHGTSLKEST